MTKEIFDEYKTLILAIAIFNVDLMTSLFFVTATYIATIWLSLQILL